MHRSPHPVPLSRKRPGGTLFFLCIGLACAGAAGAEPSAGAGGPEALLDGLSVLAGADPGKESDALPVLLSDVAFDAALISARLLGSQGAPGIGAEALRIQARRFAVFVRLLARQARQLQEEASPKEVAAVREEIVARVGGRDAMALLLARFGMGEDALFAWAENTVLASTQVRFVLLQADTPFLGEGAGLTPLDPSDPLYRHREMLKAERIAAAMRRWLQEFVGGHQVRIIR